MIYVLIGAALMFLIIIGLVLFDISDYLAWKKGYE